MAKKPPGEIYLGYYEIFMMDDGFERKQPADLVTWSEHCTDENADVKNIRADLSEQTKLV